MNKCVLYKDKGCEATNNSSARTTVNEDVEDFNIATNDVMITDTYQLFPNPAVDELFIFGSTENEEIKISIADVNGKLLIKQTLNINGYHAKLQFNLLNGVYFVTLVNQSNQQLNKKLIIAK
jgi:hypothetical protein